MNDLINRDQQTLAIATAPDLVDQWIKFADVKTTTEKNYRKAIKQFGMYLKENRIQNPTRDNVQEWKTWLMANRSAGTAQLYLTAIKLFFRFLDQHGYYPNVADHIKSPKPDKGHKKEAMNPKQISKVLAAIDRKTEAGKRDYAMLMLMFSTGLRTISIANANMEDLDRETGRLYYKGKGKEGKNAYVKVDAIVLAAIDAYLAARPKTAPNDPLFAGAGRQVRDERLRTESISRIFKTRCRKAGIDSARITAHSARHSAATIALRSGSTLEEVQQLLGHESITTTMVYIHDLNRERNQSEHRIISAIMQEA